MGIEEGNTFSPAPRKGLPCMDVSQGIALLGRMSSERETQQCFN